MSKLTHRTLETLRADQAGLVLRDEGNLFGRVRVCSDNTVTVSFYYRYRLGEKLKDFSCGTWPGHTLAQIRSHRDGARMRVAQGIDPGAQKKVTRQEERDAVAARLAAIEQQQTERLTVRDLFNVWLADGVRRKDGNAELLRSFKADVLPKIGGKAVKDLTEHDVRAVLRAMVGRGANRAAVVLRNNLTQMFAWAEKRQPWRKLLADGNPMDLIEISKIVDQDYDLNNQRDRVLSVEEIHELQAIFHRMQTHYEVAPDKRVAVQPMEQTVQRAIWIMLSTLCRVGELSMARWEHVDFDAGTWSIPRENVKGSRNDFTVYLSEFSLYQFRCLHVLTGASDWCFPSRNGEGHVDVKSISKQVGDRQVMFKRSRDGAPRKPMKNRRHDNALVLGGEKNGAWTPHDLRRTGATMMQGLGVSLDVIDRCQNHVLGGSKVRRHYLHHDYANEKREAWTLLGSRLSLILSSPGNVLPFPCQA